MMEQNGKEEKVNTPAQDAEDSLFQYEGYSPSSRQSAAPKGRGSIIKKLLPIIILGGVALLLGGAILVMQLIFPNQQDPTQQTNAVSVLSLAADKVESIQIKNEKDTYSLARKAGSVYKIVGKENLPADSDVIVTAIEKFCDIQTTKQLALESDRYKEYGLDTPAATVTLQTDSETKTLYIGIQAPSDTYYYARLDGEEKIFILDEEIAKIALSSRYRYYESDLSRYDSSNDQQHISPVVFDGKSATKLRVESTNVSEEEQDNLTPSFMMVHPVKQAFASTAMTEVLTLLDAMTALEAVCDDVNATALQKYGLVEPNYILTFGNNGEEMTIEFGKVQDDFVYLRRKGEGIIYKMDKKYIAVMGRDLADLCEMITYLQDVQNVRSIKVVGGQKTYNMTVEYQNEELLATVNGKTVDANNFSDFFSHLISISVEEQAEKPKQTDLLVTVEVVMNDGTKDVLKYYVVDERRCFYEINGSGVFNVSRLAAEKLLENAQKLYDGKEIVTEW